MGASDIIRGESGLGEPCNHGRGLQSPRATRPGGRAGHPDHQASPARFAGRAVGAVAARRPAECLARRTEETRFEGSTDHIPGVGRRAGGRPLHRRKRRLGVRVDEGDGRVRHKRLGSAVRQANRASDRAVIPRISREYPLWGAHESKVRAESRSTSMRPVSVNPWPAAGARRRRTPLSSSFDTKATREVKNGPNGRKTRNETLGR